MSVLFDVINNEFIGKVKVNAWDDVVVLKIVNYESEIKDSFSFNADHFKKRIKIVSEIKQDVEIDIESQYFQKEQAIVYPDKIEEKETLFFRLPHYHEFHVELEPFWESIKILLS